MLLSVSNLTLDRGEKRLLNGFDLEVRPGEIVGLTGPNGAGKTSLIHAILGLLPHANGEIRLLGQSDSTPDTRRRMGVVWQDGGLPVGVSSRRWLEQMCRLYGADVDQGLLSELSVPIGDRPIRSLSGGERQRLAIFAALNHRPEILLLDEPTVGLDDQSRSAFYSAVSAARSRGAGVLFTSHYGQDLAIIADRVVDLATADRPVGAAAIFTTDRPIPDPVGAGLSAVDNGYRINTDRVADLLPRAIEAAKTFDAQILSFVVVQND